MIAKFWWRSNTQLKGIHWLNGHAMGAPKELGQMGFRDFECFNLALLCKQLWWIQSRPTSLVALTRKEKYIKNTNVFKASTKCISS